jgi:hypothetical protein
MDQATASGCSPAQRLMARGDAMIGREVDMNDATRHARDVAAGEDLALREASCWIEAKQPERAAQIYEERLVANGISTRDVGYFRARQAIAFAHAEQPDQAARRALEALAISERTGSMRTHYNVQKAHRMLVRWESRDAVAALGAALNASPLPSPRQP